MALNGTIITLGKDRFGFEYRTTFHNEPTEQRCVWELDTYRLSGMSWCQEADAIGKPATITDGRVSCYLGSGNYLTGALKDGGSTKAIIQETSPVPKPKARTELRWYNGIWQKYSKRSGWITA